MALSHYIPTTRPDRVPQFSDQTAGIELWKTRANDLALSNERLRLAVDVLRLELAEEKAKHGAQ